MNKSPTTKTRICIYLNFNSDSKEFRDRRKFQACDNTVVRSGHHSPLEKSLVNLIDSEFSSSLGGLDNELLSFKMGVLGLKFNRIR